MKGHGKISVITVCRNNKEGLERTFRSLRDQGAGDIEWLVIDRASSDGSLEWLKACTYDRLRFVSELCEGSYDAMNKAVRMVSGDWVLFLGAGAVFCEQRLLPKVTAMLMDCYDMVAGSTVYFSVYGSRVCHAKPLETVKKAMPFFLQSVLIKRELLLRHPFDLRYDRAGDYEFFYWAADQRVADFVVGFPFTSFDGRCLPADREAIETQRQYRKIQGRYRGCWNQLRWKGFVGWQRIKSVMEWLIPHAVIRARKRRYYTTDC